jgi:hypothetical protein
MLAGPHALSTVGRRREARGRVALLPPGFTRASRPDDRVGPSLEALVAAPRNPVFRAVARKALEG